MRRSNFSFLFLLFFFLPFAFAQLQLPPNLAKLQDQNKAFAEEALASVGFGVAFLAGVVTFLSPCVLPILLLFIASTLEHQEGKARRFLFFLLGMGSALTLMGMAVGYLGKMSLDFFPYRQLLAEVSGWVFILLGILMISGVSFGTWALPYRARNAYCLGFLFAFGWTACTGPVLAGVLAIAALLHNIGYAGALLFVYALGIGFPFLLAATIFPHATFWKKIRIPTWLSGAIYLCIGLVLVFFQSTAIFNSLSFGLSGYYYWIHDLLLKGAIPYLGGLLLAACLVVFYYLWRRNI